MAAPAAFATHLPDHTPNPTVNPGDLIISEFRFHGPQGASDEFFEIFNTTTNKTIDLNSEDDNSVTWIEYFDEVAPPDILQITPASDSDVGPRQKYLITNKPTSGGAAQPGYSLDGYAVGNTQSDVMKHGWGDVPHDGGIALMYDPDVTDDVNERIVLDRAGFPDGKVPDNHYVGAGFQYFEGTPEPPIAAMATLQSSHFRKLNGVGLPTDTNSNAPDFEQAAPAAATSHGGQPSVLGAAGPENTGSPVVENDGATPAVANDGMYSALMSTSVGSGAFPNREYTAPSGETAGTLLVRRRVTNRTGRAITQLRFRIMQLTTYGTATSSQALLRAVSAPTAPVAGETALGATLEQPPAQAQGGGLNSSLSVALPGGSLAHGSSVVVTFKFAVDRGGSFQFGYSHEAK
jgi:hypothetical protein